MFRIQEQKSGATFLLKTRGFASFQFWFVIYLFFEPPNPRGLIIIRGAAASDWVLLLFMRAMDECKIDVNDDVQPRTVMQQRGHSPEDSFSAKMVRRTPMILEQAGHRCSCLSLESNAPRTCCIKPRVACVHGCQNGTLG